MRTLLPALVFLMFSTHAARAGGQCPALSGAFVEEEQRLRVESAPAEGGARSYEFPGTDLPSVSTTGKPRSLDAAGTAAKATCEDGALRIDLLRGGSTYQSAFYRLNAEGDLEFTGRTGDREFRQLLKKEGPPRERLEPARTTPIPDDVGGGLYLSLSEAQLNRVRQLSSVFENFTIDFQYAYLADIGDGAGVTAGRVGYTSKTGDLLEVVSSYVRAKNGNTPLARYLPCLEKINGTGETGCLFPSVPKAELVTQGFRLAGLTKVDFGKAWVESARDPELMRLQNKQILKDVFFPAQRWAKKVGIHLPLSFGVFYDTILQQGQGDSVNAVGGVVRRAQAAFARAHGGHLLPANEREEKEWIHVFLLERRETLKRPYVGEGVQQEQDRDYVSYPRADTWLAISGAGDWQLDHALHFFYFARLFRVP